MEKFFLFFIITLLTISCKSEIEKDLIGFWEIQQAYYNDEPVSNDLHTNIITFKKDNTCSLPTTISESKKDIGGLYKIAKQNDVFFLEINSSNRIFNRIFRVEKFSKKTDERSGYKFIEMTIEADSLKLDLIRKWDVR